MKELVGDYYLIAGDDEPEERPIGIWGQRHLRHLKQHRKAIYDSLFLAGKLNDYLTDIDKQADKMFQRLVKQLAEKETITEQLKANSQMEWVRRMNAVRKTATETVNNDLIYIPRTRLSVSFRTAKKGGHLCTRKIFASNFCAPCRLFWTGFGHLSRKKEGFWRSFGGMFAQKRPILQTF